MPKRLRNIAKHAYFQLLFRSGVTSWAKRRLEVAGASIVLTFHRVLTDDAIGSTNSPAGMILRQQTFADVIEWLSEEVEFVSLRELPRRSRRLSVSLTFDDGWSDNLQACLSTLMMRSIPACIFICSHIVGVGLPFWPERAIAGLRRARAARPVPQGLLTLFAEHGMDLLHVPESVLLRYLKENPEQRPPLIAAIEEVFPPLSDAVDRTMTWAELRELRQHGVELGSHTAHHEILTELAAPQQVAEMLDCNARMVYEFNVSPSFFAYPDGGWNEEAKRGVMSCGYQYAFINVPGIWSENTDPHLIPRINLSQNRLVGLDGHFSVAAAHYCLYWVPYLNRRRSQCAPKLRGHDTTDVTSSRGIYGAVPD